MNNKKTYLSNVVKLAAVTATVGLGGLSGCASSQCDSWGGQPTSRVYRGDVECRQEVTRVESWFEKVPYCNRD